MNRREFLAAAGAAAGSLALPAGRAQAAQRRLALKAQVFDQQVVTGAKTRMWGFNGSVPGPLLRLAKGDRATIELANETPQPTTVHWHGVRVDNPMDGVPYVTQDPIDQGKRFTYDFVAKDSGTFWYHPHQNSFEQVGRGLYGPLIVDEDKPPAADRDEVWVLSDLKLDARQQQVDDFGRMLDIGNDGRIGNVVTWNGRAAGAAERFEVRAGERIRLRLINCASARIFALGFEGHAPQVIAYDGQGVRPHAPAGGRVLLGPGMRADLMLDCTAKPGSTLRVVDTWRQPQVLLSLAYSGAAPLRAGVLDAPMRPPANELPEPNLSRTIDHYILFQGGMRGEPIVGMVDGKPTPIYDLMQKQSLAWTMNYNAQHEHALLHAPLLTVERNDHVLLKMINESDYWHPMHLHGHFFRVVAVGGRPNPLAEWRDTVLMAPRQAIDVAFVADNPGQWMFHCHILEHAAGGMMGTILVD